MPYLGAHMSIAGGLHKAIDRIRKVGGTALQIFSKNQRQWKSPPLTEELVKKFFNNRSKWGDYPIAIHTSYLINLASSNEDLKKKSIDALADELNRAEILKIPYVILHPGSCGELPLDICLENVVKGIDKAISLAKCKNTNVLVENTSGQGTSLGSKLEELAYIITNSKYNEKIFVCIDTAHLFQAGYDIRDSKGYKNTFQSINKSIGIEKIKFFHLNDSKTELGSRVDRHEHIGKGHIGLQGFKLLLNDPRFKDHPMVLETPKGKDLKEDIENLKVLKSLMEDENKN